MGKDFKKEILKAKKSRRKSRLVALRIPEDIHEELLDLSKETNTSLSQIIILALKQTLGKT